MGEMTNTIEPITVYDEGRKAYDEGFSLFQNPYPEKTGAFQDWVTGWLDEQAKYLMDYYMKKSRVTP